MLVFTAEEVWKYLPRDASGPGKRAHGFVPRSGKAGSCDRLSKRSKKWDRLLAVREEVLRSLEPARAEKLISSGLEARRNALGRFGIGKPAA